MRDSDSSVYTTFLTSLLINVYGSYTVRGEACQIVNNTIVVCRSCIIANTGGNKWYCD